MNAYLNSLDALPQFGPSVRLPGPGQLQNPLVGQQRLLFALQSLPQVNLNSLNSVKYYVLRQENTGFGIGSETIFC